MLVSVVWLGNLWNDHVVTLQAWLQTIQVLVAWWVLR